MKYWKYIEDGYIGGIGTGKGQIEINEEEYNTIINTIKNKPIAKKGYYYILKENLSWELAELPQEPPEQATEEDYQNLLKYLGVKL